MAVHEGLEDLQVEGIPAGDREEGTPLGNLLAPASWGGGEGVEVGEGEEGSRVSSFRIQTPSGPLSHV